MRLFYPSRRKILTKRKKQDQSCILAQIFLSCENLRLEFCCELLFITGKHRAVKYRASKCRAECAFSSPKKVSSRKEFVNSHAVMLERTDAREARELRSVRSASKPRITVTVCARAARRLPCRGEAVLREPTMSGVSVHTEINSPKNLPRSRNSVVRSDLYRARRNEVIIAVKPNFVWPECRNGWRICVKNLCISCRTS
jgi:hypothetical protein